MNVAELFIKVVLDSKTFESNMDRATDKTEELKKGQEKLGKEVEKTAKKAEDGAKKAGSAWDSLKGKLMGLLSVTAVLGSVNVFAEQTKQLEGYAKYTGMGVEGIQAWQDAIRDAGGDADSFGGKLVEMGHALNEFAVRGTGAFREFSIMSRVSFRDASGHAVGLEESLYRIADRVQGMSQVRAERILKPFGFDKQTVEVLRKGRQELETYLKAKEAQAAIDKRDLENGVKIRNAYTQLGKTYQLIGARVAGALVPVFEKVGEYAGKAFGFIKEHSASVERMFKMLGAAISVALLPKLKQMAVAAWASLGPWTLLIGAFAAIGLAIDDLIVWMEGGESALGDFWSMFGTADEVKATLAGIKDTFLGILDAVKPLGPTVLKVVGALAGLVALKRTFTAVASGIGAASAALKALFVLMRANPIGLLVTALVALGSVVADNWDEIKATVLDAWNGIVGAASGALDTIKGVFVAWGNFVRNFWGSIFGWIIDSFAAVAGKVGDLVNFGKGVVGKVKSWFGGGDKATGASAGAPAFAFAGGGTGTVHEAVASGGYGAPANARPGNVSNDNRKTVKIDQTNNITVQTQATSADGIGSAVGEAMNRNTAAQADAAFGA